MTFVKVAVRLSLLLGFCITALAVVVARLAPKPAETATQPLRPARAQYLAVNEYSDSAVGHGCRLIDSSTGRIVSMTLPANDTLLFARSAPWQDDRGRLQVVGRWLARNDDRAEGGVREVGVARCTFPDGEVLDRVPLDVVPASAPCWFPGQAPRILYGGTDGRLYQFAFEDTAGEGNGDGPERRLHPEPLTWSCAKPGQGEVRVGDPTWPTDPAFGGRLVVSLTYVDRVGDKVAFVPAQIWWLQLSDDGRAIKAAGRLTAPRARASTPVQERLPILAAAPGRGLALAYLARPAGQGGWELRLVSVSVDPGTGRPRARPRTSVCLAHDVAVSPPAFSPDGSAVLALRSPAQTAARAERFSVADALPTRDVRHLAARPELGRGFNRRLHSLELFKSPRADRSRSKS